MAWPSGGQGCPAWAGAAGAAPTLRRTRGLAPPAGGSLVRPQRAARLPLPSPPGERVRGGAGARSRLCRGPSAERAWRGSGEGGLAAFSPAVRRWQQVPVCTAASAAGAAGAGHRTLAFPAGGLASRVGRKVQGSHFSCVGRQGPHNPTPGVFLEPSFLSLHHCRSCLPPHPHLPSQAPITSSRKSSPDSMPGPLWSTYLPWGWWPSLQLY